VHEPVVSNETDAPETEHTDELSDENDTESPDDADADSDTGDWARFASAGAANEIDCAIGAAPTWKLRGTDGAALKVALPGWSAWIVHVPAVSNATEEPVTEQTPVVVDENDTAKADDADADTEIGDCTMFASAGALNEIDWASLETTKLCCADGAALYVALPA